MGIPTRNVDNKGLSKKEKIALLRKEHDKYTWDEITEEIVDLYDEDTLIDLLPDKQPELTEIGKLEATAPDYGVGK